LEKIAGQERLAQTGISPTFQAATILIWKWAYRPHPPSFGKGEGFEYGKDS
jgi:hypothetical protein